ncbi:MAG: HAD family hydrolase [Fretibacterium sp.]|nr:HAD family hydrolase [Fretibacterium sp.]
MIKLMIFDHDMTIVDSSHALMEGFNLMADAVGLPRTTHERVMACIALPLPQFCEGLFGRYQPSWGPLFQEKAALREHELIHPFHDTIPTIKRLHEMGIICAVASNREDPRPVMERSGLAPYFDVMIGAEGLDGGPRLRYKPAPDMLNVLLEHFCLPAEQAVYVGDADSDIETARAAGMRGIGITRGNFTARQFLDMGAWRAIEALSELPGIAEADERQSPSFGGTDAATLPRRVSKAVWPASERFPEPSSDIADPPDAATLPRRVSKAVWP